MTIPVNNMQPFRAMKTGMIMAVHVVCIKSKSEAKSPFGIPKLRWGNATEVDLKKTVV
jgi:hypothetical protein